ncbi:MAG TPA: hypothetical protein VLV50_12425 [Stellaceae bacterium]|nr:hypothetical protein [Stellaceae bacterium]
MPRSTKSCKGPPQNLQADRGETVDIGLVDGGGEISGFTVAAMRA